MISFNYLKQCLNYKWAPTYQALSHLLLGLYLEQEYKELMMSRTLLTHQEDEKNLLGNIIGKPYVINYPLSLRRISQGNQKSKVETVS